MNTLALDLGTATGFALRHNGANVTGTWSFKPSRFDGGGMRYLKFRRKLDETFHEYAIDVVYYEAVRRHLGVDAAHAYGGFLGQLGALCEELEIPYEGVPVGTIKKWFTGKGNAKKHEMIAEAKKRGFAPTDDNEADAIAILLMKTADPTEALCG